MPEWEEKKKRDSPKRQAPGEVLSDAVFQCNGLDIIAENTQREYKYCLVWIWYLLLESLFEYELEEVSCLSFFFSLFYIHPLVAVIE